jgi:hypothetical protein
MRSGDLDRVQGAAKAHVVLLASPMPFDVPSARGSIVDGAPGFSELCVRWFDVTYAAAYEVLRSHMDAEDAAQRVFVRLWRKRASSWEPIKACTLVFLEGLSHREAGQRLKITTAAARRSAWLSGERTWTSCCRPWT